MAHLSQDLQAQLNELERELEVCPHPDRPANDALVWLAKPTCLDILLVRRRFTANPPCGFRRAISPRKGTLHSSLYPSTPAQLLVPPLHNGVGRVSGLTEYLPLGFRREEPNFFPNTVSQTTLEA